MLTERFVNGTKSSTTAASSVSIEVSRCSSSSWVELSVQLGNVLRVGDQSARSWGKQESLHHYNSTRLLFFLSFFFSFIIIIRDAAALFGFFYEDAVVTHWSGILSDFCHGSETQYPVVNRAF